jgi:hypothetical protein
LISADVYRITIIRNQFKYEGNQVDTLKDVYHKMLVPYGDSSVEHFDMAQRYAYLHDQVNFKIEMNQSKYWDQKADSVIKKYHIIEIINRYKYPVNQL